MSNLQIDLKEDTFENSSNRITGVIYFKLADYCFPESDWNDFAIVVLNWWAESIVELVLEGESSSAEFSFMDGPFEVSAEKESATQCRLSFIDTKRKKVEFSARVSSSHLLDAISEATKKALNICWNQSWENDAVAELRRSNKKLSALVKSLKADGPTLSL